MILWAAGRKTLYHAPDKFFHRRNNKLRRARRANPLDGRAYCTTISSQSHIAAPHNTLAPSTRL
jgi:hypothetical protein